MTQNEFFNILMDELKELPELKIQKIIFYYKDRFSVESSIGRTEEEIIKDFGDPYLICLKYINQSQDCEIAEYKNNITSNNIILHEVKSDDKYIQEINMSVNKKNNNTQCSHKKKINLNKNHTKSSPNVDRFLKFCIIILGLFIFFPVVTSIIAIIIGILGIALSLLAGSIGILIGGTFTSLIRIPYISHIPQIITNFPYPVIILFTLGSITLSILLIFIFYYSCKFFFRLFTKTFKLLKSTGGLS